MTAEARSYPELNETADDLWADNGDKPTGPPPAARPAAPVTRAGSTHAGRYSAGAVIAGKYQLVEVLGEGGMGSVWLARNRTLDVDVALKLMRSELAEDVEGIAERMLQEARAAACIGHPAIIQVFDFGFAEHGDPFIAMELLRGESLAHALRRRSRVLPTRAAQTLLPIIDALGAAHARGIVHRDLKPENIFLARPAGHRLQPKVLDFGIAKLEQRAAERLTRDGAVIGSPAYMSPEQLRGDRDVDARADVWALCVVLYQMITGRRPFEGDGYQAAIWWNVLNAEPRPIAEHGLDEPELWKILELGFAKEAAGRYPDMRALGRTLAEWLVARGVQQDICDASLRAWIDPVDAEAARLHSFFPSQDPGPEEPAKIVVDPLGQVLEEALASSGTRPIQPAARSLRARFGASDRGLLWLTALGALLAFVGAAGFAAWTSDQSEANEPAPAVERHRHVSTNLASPAPRAPDRALPPEPAPSFVRPPEPSTPAASPRPRPARPPARRAHPAQDLKNPYG
jgi:serine/threonine-protein kinase